MLPFPFGEDLPSQAQKTHCQQSRIVHVAAFALSNSGESERYLCYLMLSLIFIYLNYLGVAPPFSRWQLEIRSSKVFPKVFQGALCWASTPRCSGPAPVLPLRGGTTCQPRHVDAVPAAAPWAKDVTVTCDIDLRITSH